ncbi:MAG: hypothetical protein K6V36_12525, partial [Anaerolineae bacterium]|nr:hypothetical protein [Anaerolineae bacterium]
VRGGRAVWRGTGIVVLLSLVDDAADKERAAAKDPRTARALHDAVTARVLWLREMQRALALLGGRPAPAVAEDAGLPWPGPAELLQWDEADWAAWGRALLAALDSEIQATLRWLMAAPPGRKRHHRSRLPWRLADGRRRAAAAGGGR